MPIKVWANTMHSSVRVSPSVIEIVVSAAVANRPNEACGILLGRMGENAVSIVRAVAASNAWEPAAERVRRYALDPCEQVAAERAARAEGLDVVGYYHSHPSSGPVPSGIDRESAWPLVVYLIVGFSDDGRPVLRAWVLDSGGMEFVELRIDTAV